MFIIITNINMWFKVILFMEKIFVSVYIYIIKLKTKKIIEIRFNQILNSIPTYFKLIFKIFLGIKINREK